MHVTSDTSLSQAKIAWIQNNTDQACLTFLSHPFQCGKYTVWRRPEGRNDCACLFFFFSFKMRAGHFLWSLPILSWENCTTFEFIKSLEKQAHNLTNAWSLSSKQRWFYSRQRPFRRSRLSFTWLVWRNDARKEHKCVLPQTRDLNALASSWGVYFQYMVQF